MSVLRLLIALLIVAALPLHGIAASTCGYPVRQSHVAAHAAEDRAGAAGESGAGPASMATHQAKARMTGMHHTGCPGCVQACCHPAAPAPSLVLAEAGSPVAVTVAELPVAFASWAEPVPHGPPRS